MYYSFKAIFIILQCSDRLFCPRKSYKKVLDLDMWDLYDQYNKKMTIIRSRTVLDLLVMYSTLFPKKKDPVKKTDKMVQSPNFKIVTSVFVSFLKKHTRQEPV